MSTVETDAALAGLPVEEPEAGSKIWGEEERRARAGRAEEGPDLSQGVAFVDGAYGPIAEARIPITDWGFVRSDVTYDVVHVWKGSFFRLEDHIERFLRSVEGLRMDLPVSRHELREVLIECVRRSGLRDAYVEMVCTRGQPPPGAPRHPRFAAPNFLAFAVPYIWVYTPEQQERGLRAIISSVPRIPSQCVDPTIKNFHWGDLTRALFEAADKGAEQAVLLDIHGNLAEGPGFNVFAVIEGTVTTPPGGALEGITRRSVLELCEELGLPAQERDITADELREADEIFFSTTAGGITGVSRIDERILGNDRPGPITERLRELYWRKHEEGWHATPVDYG
jgi:branched-chain amino acid aminotransferase